MGLLVGELKRCGSKFPDDDPLAMFADGFAILLAVPSR
jgi:hypothetical protein